MEKQTHSTHRHRHRHTDCSRIWVMILARVKIL